MKTEQEINNEKILLTQKMKELNDELILLKQEEYNQKVLENEEKLNKLRIDKDLILTLFSCGCEDTSLDRYGNPHCKECFLAEILDQEWNNDWKVRFDIQFYKIGE